jgi:hypothetical protein
MHNIYLSIEFSEQHMNNKNRLMESGELYRNYLSLTIASEPDE